MKLVSELYKCLIGKSFYILDELIMGFYVDDIVCLFKVLDCFVDDGNIVFVIEYNFDVIKIVDYIIDFGFEGGIGGG